MSTSSSVPREKGADFATRLKSSAHSIASSVSSLASSASSSFSSSISSSTSPNSSISVGSYLARYLHHVGIDTVFVVPGDYNLKLLDELMAPVPVPISPRDISSTSTFTSSTAEYSKETDFETRQRKESNEQIQLQQQPQSQLQRQRQQQQQESKRQLKLVCSTNELNCGYSADGYARARGVGALVVTYGVGSLSCVNAIAGAFAERIPLIVISGGLNSNALADGEMVHHSTTETHLPSYDSVRKSIAEFTACAVTITRATDAPRYIHQAISAALRHRRPVLIDIACNISTLPAIPSRDDSHPLVLPDPLRLRHQWSDPSTLHAAVRHVIDVLNRSSSIVFVVGEHLRPVTVWPGNTCLSSSSSDSSRICTPATNPFLSLVERLNTVFVSLLGGKAMLDEGHPNYLGIYSANCSVVPGLKGSDDASGGNAIHELLESVDCVVYVGCVLSDYASAGHTFRNRTNSAHGDRNLIFLHQESVVVDGQMYHEVELGAAIRALERLGETELKPNDTAFKLFKKYRETASPKVKAEGKVAEEIQMKLSKFPLNLDRTAVITSRSLTYYLQELVDQSVSPYPSLHVVSDSGDAWIYSMKLRLPFPHSFDIQMQYGSIGWSVGAVNGLAESYSRNHQKNKRVLGLIGDGAFQLTAQELSAMIRYKQTPILVILNNHYYGVEEEIHSGPYNRINNWKYADLVQVFDLGVFGKELSAENKPVSYRCEKVGELSRAIEEARIQYSDRLVLIEVQLDPKDSNVELGMWTAEVSKAVNRQPYSHLDVHTFQ